MTESIFEDLGKSLFKAVEEFIMSRIQSKQKHNIKLQEEAKRKLKIDKSRQNLKLRKSMTNRDYGKVHVPQIRQIRTYTEATIKQEDLGTVRLSQNHEEKQN